MLYFGMKTAISLPDELFDEADAVAARIGMSRSQLYATALAEYLAKFRGGSVTARLNAVHAFSQRTHEETLNAVARKTVRRAEW